MALFKSKKLRKLEAENIRLQLAFDRLEDEVRALKHQRIMRAYELEKELVDKLNLAVDQKVILKYIFLMERAKAMDIPEDIMREYHQTIEEVFTSKES